jgi:hypothetical protein
VAPSLYDQLTREHPAYVAGFTQGRDVGIRTALDVVVAEMARQEDAAITGGSDSTRHVSAGNHAYAAGRLHEVARTVGAAFRNAQA